MRRVKKPVRREKYDVIYADPPWRYGFASRKNQAIENHYPTMTLADIKALDVPAASNSVLYLWTTAPKLIEGLEVMEAWGFTYKSCAIWDKVNLGIGFWWRGQHEILLVGTRGKFSPPPAELRVSSVFREKKTKHSRKPDAIRDLIASWFPDARRLEMFCREPAPGWSVWGNEVSSNILINGK